MTLCRRSRAIIVVALAWMLAAGSESADAEVLPLSLEQAQRQAANQAHAVLTAAQELEVARSSRRQSLATVLPSVRVGQQWMRTDDAVGVFGSRLRQERFTQADFALSALNEPAALTNVRTMIEIQQPLFSGGGALSQRRAAAEQVEAASARLVRTRQHMQFAAAEAYWRLVLSFEALSVVEAGVAAAMSHALQAEKAWRAGSVSRSQMLAARLRVAELEANLIDAHHQRDVANDGLTHLLNLPLATLLEPADELDLPSIDPLAKIDSSTSESPHRADVRALDAQLRASRHMVRREGAAYLPEIHAFARFAWDGQKPLRADGETWSAGASLSWSIFDGFLTQGRVQQARARATQIDLALVDLHNRVDRQVRDAARQLDAAQQRAEVAATAIASAQEHLRVTRIEYDHGIVTTTELLDAEVVRRSAQLRLLQAIHDVRISKARQQFALGTSLNL